jgi:hypothetical protein
MTARSSNPRSMETTADEGMNEKPEEFICAKCNRPITPNEPHAVWLNFGVKADEHFHDSCFSSPTALRNPREPESPVIKQFPDMIGDGVAACMRDRNAHMRIEKELDAWVNNLSPNKVTRNNQLRDAREQIETAKLALDVLYGRFRTLASTAKN